MITLDIKKMGLLKTFPRRLKDVSDVCSPAVAYIWNKKFCLTKIYQKILNWRMLYLFLKER